MLLHLTVIFFSLSLFFLESINLEIKFSDWNQVDQTKIPYPKPLKHSKKTKLRLNESKNNSLKIYFLIIKTHFS